MKHLIKLKFREDADEVYLTHDGQPVEVDHDRLASQLEELRAGEGMLGDLFASHGDRWHIEQIRVIPLPEGWTTRESALTTKFRRAANEFAEE